MKYEDEPVLGEKQAKIKLNMIQEEKEFANYIKNLLNKYGSEIPTDPNLGRPIKDYFKENTEQIPKLKVYDMIIIEDESGSIYQECIKWIGNIIYRCFTDNFTIDFTYIDNHEIKINRIKHNSDSPYKFNFKEIYRRIDDETFKRIWKED